MATDETTPPPTRTLMQDLVERQVMTGFVNVFTKTTDRVVEEMVLELLRDPDLRAQWQRLVRAAFEKALQDLQLPPDPDAKKRRY